jgi:hypothetical protein
LATTATLGLVIANPVPVVDSLTPTMAMLPVTDPLTLTFLGAGFTSSSALLIRDSAGGSLGLFATPFVTAQTATRLVLTLPDSLFRSITTPTTLLLNVANPHIGTYEEPLTGGVDTSAAQSLSFIQPLAPTLTMLSATTATVGVANLTLTLTGTNFVNAGVGNARSSFVRWSVLNAQGMVTGVVDIPATVISTTPMNANQLSIAVPAALLSTAAAVQVQVVTPGAPTVSAPLSFAMLNPIPTLTSLSPGVVLVGTFTQDLTLTGTNFAPRARVLLNDQTIPSSLVSATQMRLTLTAAQMQRAALLRFRVVNDSVIVNGNPNGNPQGTSLGGGTSSELVLPVVNPVPTLTVLSPAYGLVGQPPTLTLTGTGLFPSSSVSVGGTTLPATAITSLSPTQLSITVPPALTATAGMVSVVVTNPAVGGLGGGTSDTLSFALLHPTPTLATLSPTTTTLPLTTASVTLTLTGTGFSAGTQVLMNNPSLPATALVVQTITPTTITAQIPATLLLTATTFSVTVQNPSISGSVGGVPLPLNGGTSAAQTFALINARPPRCY